MPMPALPQSARLFAATLPLLALGGCGGGSAPLYDNSTFSSAIGDQSRPAQRPDTSRFVAGDGTGFSAPQASVAALNADDAPRITGSVLSLIDTIGEVGGTGNDLGRIGRDIFTGLRRTAPRAALHSVLQRVLGALATADTPPRLLGAVQEGPPQTGFDSRRCDGDASGGDNPFGGSYDIQSFSAQAGGSFFLSGNVMTVNFYDCILDGTTLNGGLNIADFLFRDDPATEAYDPVMSGSISFNGFSMNRGRGVVNLATGSGGTLDYRSRFQGERLVSTRIGSGALTISKADNVNDRLQDMAVTIDFDPSNATYSLQATGAVDSSLSGTQLTITTRFPLRWQAGDPHPFGGSLQIADASQASITLTALDMSQVRLEVDEDGDGAVDSDLTLPWSALLP